MGLSRTLLVFVFIGVTCLCSGQDTLSTTPSSSSLKDGPVPGREGMAPNDSSNGPGGTNSQIQPVWLKCVSQVTSGDKGDENIATVLSVWCKNYESIINCLSSDIAKSAPSNPLDFFINLNFNADQLKAKSQNICANLQEKSDKLSCAATTNETLARGCAGAFSGGLVHVFGLHKEKDAPDDVLRGIACDVTLQTTFCLRDTLPECDDDVQMVLLNYYSLFTNETCVAQKGPPQTVVAKCAKEAAETLTPEQSRPEPTSLLDFLILGLKTDCKTYSVRYACYERELANITNFRDFWLSLTFDYDNAIASQDAYCAEIEERVIPKINDECFNKSQPGLAACEGGFGREVEAIREEWFNNSDFDGIQLQRLACRTSVTRAACLDKAMQPCGEDVSRAMAVSEMGILPEICRRLLAPDSSAKSGPASGRPGDIGSNTAGQGDNRPLSGYDSNSNGNYRPREGNLPRQDNEIPLSDQAPQGNGGTTNSGYNTSKSKETMSDTSMMDKDSKKAGNGDMKKKGENNVSASESQADGDGNAASSVAVNIALTLTCFFTASLFYR